MRKRLVLLIGGLAIVAVALAAVIVVTTSHHETIDATTSSEAPPSLPQKSPTRFDKPTWTTTVPAWSSNPVVTEGYLIAGERGGARILDLATGHERWHYLDSAHSLRSSKGVITGGRHVALIYNNSYANVTVQVFDLATGQLQRSVQLDQTGDVTNEDPNKDTFVLYEDTLVVLPPHLATSKAVNQVRAISLHSGSGVWSWKPESCDNYRGSFGSVYPHGPLILGISCRTGRGDFPATGKVVALDPSSGNVLWQKTYDNFLALEESDSPILLENLPDGAPLLYRIATPTDALVAIDPATGERESVVSGMSGFFPNGYGGGWAQDAATPTSDGWCIYRQADNRTVSCFDKNSGTKKWEYQIPRTDLPLVFIFPTIDSIAIVTIKEGNDPDNRIAVLDSATGKLRIQETTIGQPDLGPEVNSEVVSYGTAGLVMIFHTSKDPDHKTVAVFQ